MPLISWSCSMLVNAPLVSRQARMFCAITGPTPGRESSAASSALFRLTSADPEPPGDTGPAAAGAVPPPGPDEPDGDSLSTMESPSVSLAARVTPVRSAAAVAPPAAAMASATRAPGGNVTSPAFLTRPVTETTTSLAAAESTGAAVEPPAGAGPRGDGVGLGPSAS